MNASFLSKKYAKICFFYKQSFKAMLKPESKDSRNNSIIVCLFESYVARFFVENPHYFISAYQKLIKDLQNFLENNPKDNPELKKFILCCTAGISLERRLFSIFSRTQKEFLGFDSFEAFQGDFKIAAADYLIKLIADDILIPTPQIINPEEHFISSPSLITRRSPSNPFRNPTLFEEANRGVHSKFSDTSDDEDSEEYEYFSLGIMEPEFCPMELSYYFLRPIEPAGHRYIPNENSFVAQWLRKMHCPIVSGSSGSTELMINRIFPLSTLSQDEKKLIIFCQAWNMVAYGHHSFFEAMIVANDLGLFHIEAKETVLEFYMQCIPESIQLDPLFIAFIDSELIRSLPLNQLFSEQENGPEHFIHR